MGDMGKNSQGSQTSPIHGTLCDIKHCIYKRIGSNGVTIMKQIRIIIIFILAICTVGACHKSNEELVEVDKILIGESAHWKASYKVKGFLKFYMADETLQTESDGSYELIIEYKGTLKELTTMKRLEIEYPSGGSSKLAYGLNEVPDSLTFVYKGDINPHIIPKISQGKPLEITVIWNGINGSKEIIQVK